MAKEFRVVGKQVRDISAADRVSGQLQFSNDVQLPGMLHAKLLKSPYARAKVLNVDSSAAQALPGVKLVMTKDNFPFLFQPEVVFVGQDVACVVAEDQYSAEKAVRLLKVEYEVLPFVIDPYEALKPDAPIALPYPANSPEPPSNIRKGTYAFKHFSEPNEKGLFTKRSANVTDYDGFGDIDEAKKEVEVFVKGEGYNFGKANAPLMALSGCVANYCNGKLDLYMPTQYAGQALGVLTQILKLDSKDINIISVVTGGGFGGRLSSGVMPPNTEASYTLVSAMASMALNEPVRLFYTREEEFYYYWGRSGMDAQTEIGFKKDGTLVTMETEVWRNISTGGPVGIGTQNFDATCTGNMLYSRNCRANRLRKHCVSTNGPSFCGWQGFGNPEVFLAVETTMDDAAEKLGIDPVELRRKNHMRGGDNFLTLSYLFNDATWLGHTGIDKCLDEALKKVDWKGRKPASEKTGVMRHGIGMSIHAQQNGGEGFVGNATVKLYGDGSVVLVCSYHDLGQSGRTAQCQIAAEALGLPFEKVRIAADESLYAPYANAMSCSSGTFIQGNTTFLACTDAKNKLLQYASKIFDCPTEELDTLDVTVFPKNAPEKAIPWMAVFKTLGYLGPLDTIMGVGRYEASSGPKPAEQGATFAELDVDTETGELKNIKVTISQDCGKAINPRVVAAHYLGVHHCLEAVTGGCEQILDKKTGKLLNNSYIDYPVATMLDHEVVPIIVEVPDPSTAYGWVGIGQAFNNGIAAAVSNAIYNAIGVRMKETPFTPDRILKALGKI